MAEKFSVGDTISMEGEITRLDPDSGKVTLRLSGFDYPLTVRPQHVALVAKAAKRGKRTVREDA